MLGTAALVATTFTPVAWFDPPPIISRLGELRRQTELRRLGVLSDVPLCRFSWCILPGHQVTLNIWQPQYTLMFNRLLGEPGPHYYLHVLLPGGAESLGEPGYELEPDSKASLVGTLCRVAVGQRLGQQGRARGAGHDPQRSRAVRG